MQSGAWVFLELPGWWWASVFLSARVISGEFEGMSTGDGLPSDKDDLELSLLGAGCELDTLSQHDLWGPAVGDHAGAPVGRLQAVPPGAVARVHAGDSVGDGEVDSVSGEVDRVAFERDGDEDKWTHVFNTSGFVWQDVGQGDVSVFASQPAGFVVSPYFGAVSLTVHRSPHFPVPLLKYRPDAACKGGKRLVDVESGDVVADLDFGVHRSDADGEDVIGYA